MNSVLRDQGPVPADSLASAHGTWHRRPRPHLRQLHEPRPGGGAHRRPPGRRAGLPLVLDRRDNWARGLLAARCRRRRRPGPRPRHGCARPPTAHADGRGHGRRDPPGPAPRAGHPPRYRHLVAGGHRALARGTVRRPAPGPGAGVRHAREGVPHRRARHLPGRLLPVQEVPPRGAPGRAPAEGGGRRPQPQDARPRRRGGRRRAAQLPAGVARGLVGRTGPQGRRRRRLRLRPRRCLRARGRHRLRPTRPVVVRRGRRLRRQLRAGRLRRRGGPDPRVPGRRRP